MFSPWLARYTKLLAAATLILIVAGGLVTSTGSGLSVPDWPTSYGYNMFLFPLDLWVGGVRFEHSHRLIASAVGMITIGLVVFLFAREGRRWVRRLGVVALVAVCTQGLLGGLTVRYLLPLPISVSHACLAQTFFALTVALAVFTSRGWHAAQREARTPALAKIFRVGMATAGVIWLQLLLGALMRHMGAGLAIPTYPLAPGGALLPSFSEPGTAVHFAHRWFALVVVIHVVLLGARALRSGDARLRRPAIVLLLATAAQVALGIATVLSGKKVTPTTAHVAVGAFVLANALVIALRAWRPSVPAPAAAGDESGPAPAARDLVELAKPRMTALILATTAAGYHLGAGTAAFEWATFAFVLLATCLLAGGAAALNQWIERENDQKMERTAGRPIPSGRVAPGDALAFGLALSLAGLAGLIVASNPLAAAVGAATLFTYVLVYTPLKRRTWLCTLVGAVPGALPPLIGWAAARGTLGAPAWTIFAILFIWQLPHFFAIAWLYREDYARAGYPMLSVGDRDGLSTARNIAGYSIALVPVSLAPAFLGISGDIYLFGAIALGIAHLALALGAAAGRSRLSARRLFFASIVYLPALFALLSADKVR